MHGKRGEERAEFAPSAAVGARAMEDWNIRFEFVSIRMMGATGRRAVGCSMWCLRGSYFQERKEIK